MARRAVASRHCCNSSSRKLTSTPGTLRNAPRVPAVRSTSLHFLAYRLVPRLNTSRSASREDGTGYGSYHSTDSLEFAQVNLSVLQACACSTLKSLHRYAGLPSSSYVPSLR